MTGQGRPELRILLVEDEPANRAFVRAILARADPAEIGPVVLHEAASLGEARAALVAERFNAVLVDVRLPDGNGLDLAAELRSGDTGETATVVVVSASVLPHERSTALASGADSFLGKPFSPADLIELLRGLRIRERRWTSAESARRRSGSGPGVGDR